MSTCEDAMIMRNKPGFLNDASLHAAESDQAAVGVGDISARSRSGSRNQGESSVDAMGVETGKARESQVVHPVFMTVTE